MLKEMDCFFSKGVILVEGDAEEILIPQIVKIIWYKLRRTWNRFD